MRKSRKIAGMAVALSLTGLVMGQVGKRGSVSPGPSGYRVVRTIPLGGEGLWDRLELDSTTRRLYVPRDTHVMVLDADTGAVIGSIPDTQGVRGVALAPELGRGFSSNGRTNTVTVFDLKTLKTTGTVQTGKNPDAIVYDSPSKTVFSMNSGNQSITAINATNGTVRGTIRLVDDPEGAVTDGKGNLYVNIADPAEIAVIDVAKLSLRRRIPLAPCQEPRGIAMDIKTRRLFSGCSNEIMVVTDADSGGFIAKVQTGGRTDSVAFDPGHQLAFTANGVGTVTVVREESPNKFTVVENVKTKRGARSMVLDGKTHRIFLATAAFRSAAQIEEPNFMEPNSFVILIVGK